MKKMMTLMVMLMAMTITTSANTEALLLSDMGLNTEMALTKAPKKKTKKSKKIHKKDVRFKHHKHQVKDAKRKAKFDKKHSKGTAAKTGKQSRSRSPHKN